MCEPTSDLNLWIEDFLRKRRFSKYELELIGNTTKGDGYLGEVAFVKVLTGIGRQEEKTYNLVIKSAKKSDELRKKTPIKEVFEREMFMYNSVFPAFLSLQKENAVEDLFMKFAKCYSVYKEPQREAILLQNLKHLGYEIHDRTKPQNLDHALCVFTNYGKFHALSLAMKKQHPELYSKLTKDMSDLLLNFIIQANMLDNMTDTYKAALEKLKKDDEKAYKKLANVDQDMIKMNLTKIRDPKDGLSVILHGDCWNNNMMFKYQDASKKKPTDMVFLDFQLSTVGSPIYDLSYYLYSIADENLLKYHDLLLQTYHRSLVSFLRELKEESINISLEDIKRHWIEYGKFGLTMAALIVKVELSEVDEVVDIAEVAEAGDLNDTFNVEIKNMDDYDSRMKAGFRHYASLV
ncbi:uncharacterized protein LOC126735954 [Anthonomus grandis grandis]|uniref:uncharacterized protein LOC126735954 n=1 Tax=Anthonomus grandis grandis TaxID=2921223 RepID=UPI0021664B96|nr:uncharacterized protein LOC126735954 [Anthonomus grandis grandis]